MIYFIQEGASGPIKIGFSSDVKKRVCSLRVGNLAIRLLGVLTGTREDEKRLHQRFQSHRISGEWFHPNQELLEYASTLLKEPPARELRKLERVEHVAIPSRQRQRGRRAPRTPAMPLFSRLPFSPSQVLVPLEESLDVYEEVEFCIPSFLNFVEVQKADRGRAWELVRIRLVERGWKLVRRFYGGALGFGETYFSPNATLEDALGWLGEGYQRTTGSLEEGTLVGYWRGVSSQGIRRVLFWSGIKT